MDLPEGMTVNDLFPSRWLSAADLPASRPVAVTVETISLEPIRQRDGSQEMRAVMRFRGARKTLILNKTQARAMAEITGTAILQNWIGARITLVAGTAPNGRPTIVIQPASNNTPPPPPPAAEAPATATTNDATEAPAAADDDGWNDLPSRGAELAAAATTQPASSNSRRPVFRNVSR